MLDLIKKFIQGEEVEFHGEIEIRWYDVLLFFLFVFLIFFAMAQ